MQDGMLVIHRDELDTRAIDHLRIAYVPSIYFPPVFPAPYKTVKMEIHRDKPDTVTSLISR